MALEDNSFLVEIFGCKISPSTTYDVEFGPPSAIVSKANFIQHTTDYLPDYPASWVAIIMYIKAKLIVLPKHAVLHQR